MSLGPDYETTKEQCENCGSFNTDIGYQDEYSMDVICNDCGHTTEKQLRDPDEQHDDFDDDIDF